MNTLTRLTPRKSSSAYRPLVILAAVVTAVIPAPRTATAAVSTCSGIGLTTSNVQYGTCTTDANGGFGSVSFSTDGFTATLAAKAHKGTETVASFWSSNGPVSVTSGNICVTVDVTQADLRGLGAVEQDLNLSYNGAQQAPLTSQVTSTGSQTYCGAVPSGATNVFWELITSAGGSKPTAQARIEETLTGVSY